MLTVITARGVEEAARYLTDASGRILDLSTPLDQIGDDIFAFQRRWWASDGGGTWGAPAKSTLERDARDGRDPRIMRDTGGLERRSTVRGADRQRVRVQPASLLIEITDGLASIQEARGREVLGEPPAAEQDRYAEKVASYILDGGV